MKASPRLVVLLLFALFFIPVLSAYLLNVFNPGWLPFGTTNHGTLLDPARAVPLKTLVGVDGERLQAEATPDKWTWLFIAPPACDEACQTSLYNMRQARLALGKDANRLRRVYVSTEPWEDTASASLMQEHPGLVLSVVAPDWVAAFAVDEQAPLEAGRVYLVDPQGFLVMYYEPQSAPAGLLKDIKRLLRISKIG